MKKLRLGVPDLVSNSYFPAIAAVELGLFKRENIDASIELVYPGNRTFEHLREGLVDFVAAPAHSALAVFPAWQGSKLVAALSQGTYWLLVMDRQIAHRPGDLDALKGRRIGAAPFVELSFRQLLIDAGYDLERDNIRIVPVPGADEPGVSFGIAAARALEARAIDGFWANGLGAETAIRSGTGDVILDVRRGLGPAAAFDYTFPALVASAAAIARDPEFFDAGVRAVVAAQAALRGNVGLARRVGDALFPPGEAAMIEDVVRRDLPYYAPHISERTFAGLVRFAQARNLLRTPVAYESAVGVQYRPVWNGAS
jgi:hypothetical protein